MVPKCRIRGGRERGGIFYIGAIFFLPNFGTKLVSITFYLSPEEALLSVNIMKACLDTCVIFCFAILD